jgi:hypothetical protein
VSFFPDPSQLPSLPFFDNRRPLNDLLRHPFISYSHMLMHTLHTHYHNQIIASTWCVCVHITYHSTVFGRPSKAAIKKRGGGKASQWKHDHMQVVKLVGVLAAALSSSYTLHGSPPPSLSLSLPLSPTVSL